METITQPERPFAGRRRQAADGVLVDGKSSTAVKKLDKLLQEAAADATRSLARRWADIGRLQNNKQRGPDTAG